MGESFQSMGRMSGAAGFNRDNVASRGMTGAGSTGFSYQDPSGGTGGGGRIGGEDGGMGGYKPSSPMKSGRRSLRMAGGNTSSEVTASMDKDRPPLYVPQRRESGADNRSRGDQNY